METYKVSYFQGKGNAEIIRLALVAAGKDFEDERMDREEWMKRKQDSPTKQMPLLTVTDQNGKSTVYGQSGACARYVAKKYGLFGSTPEEELLVDEVIEMVTDLQREISRIHFERDETRKEEMRKRIMEDSLPRTNDYIKLRTKQFGKNGFIIGSKLTLADLHLYNIVEQVTSRIEGMLTPFPDLIAQTELVKKDQRIVDWNARMPKPQF